MKIRIRLLNTDQIDFDAPEGFNLEQFAISVKETGRWMNPQVYVPHDKIVSIVMLADSGQPMAPKVQGVLQ